jgi:hypothetical protein
MTDEPEARRVPTQADRDAAADLIAARPQVDNVDIIRHRGADSSGFVQAFARHASTARAEGIKEGLRMAAEVARRQADHARSSGVIAMYGITASHGYGRAADAIATAIEALAPSEGEGR